VNDTGLSLRVRRANARAIRVIMATLAALLVVPWVGSIASGSNNSKS